MGRQLTLEEKIEKAKKAAADKAAAEALKNGLSEEDTKLFIESEVEKVVYKLTNEVTDEVEIKEKTYLVETPVKNFVGEVAGVQFAYGKAKVKTGWILDWFKERGYAVKEIEE